MKQIIEKRMKEGEIKHATGENKKILWFPRTVIIGVSEAVCADL